MIIYNIYWYKYPKLVLNVQVVYINKSYPLPMTTAVPFEADSSHQGASTGTFINTLRCH